MNETEDRLARLFAKIVKLIRKRDIKGILLVVTIVCFPFLSWLLSWLIVAGKGSIPYGQVIIWGVCAVWLVAICWLFVVFLCHSSLIDIPKNVVLPKSVKGLSPFTEADGDFFQYLGRSGEIERLVQQSLDREFPIVVLRGQPGSGKTSLLYAGLRYELTKKEIPHAYWRAVPGYTLQQFETAIETQLGSNLAEDFAVIIIDQFEQLQPGSPGHDWVSSLLKMLCEQSPPYQRKFIIAFREQYHPIWLDIEGTLNGVPTGGAPVALEPLTPETAKEIMATILHGASVIVDDAPLDLYVWSTSVNPGVSPLNIGFGCLAFSSWARKIKRGHIKLKHYRKAGGASGVLVTHVEQLLDEYVKPDHRKLLLKSLLNFELVSAEEIARDSGIDIGMAKAYIHHLAAPEARVFERVEAQSGQEKYILADGRLAQVLRVMNEDAFSKDHRVTLFLTEQFERWRQTKSWLHLLSAREVWQSFFRKGPLFGAGDKSPREKYLAQSLRFIAFKMLAAAVVVACLTFGGVRVSRDLSAMRQLMSWRLPPDLYNHQQQLKALNIAGAPITDLRWLRSARLSDLDINSTAWESIDGISNASGLQTVTLSLSSSKVKNLRELGGMQGIKTLTLTLGETPIQNLAELRNLSSLENLTLHLSGSRIHDVADLGTLQRLRTLDLDLRNSPLNARVIEGLTNLGNVTDLKLDLSESKIREIPDLTALSSLTGLTVNLQKSQIRSLSNLTLLKGLRKLDLDLAGCSSMKDLPDLSGFKNLDTLVLTLNDTSLLKLPAGMESLKNLQHLKLILTTTHIRDLPDFGQFLKLQSLELNLGPDIDRLPGLSQSTLSHLELNFTGSRSPSLQDLSQIRNLSELNIDIRPFKSNLPDLQQLRGLQSLELHLEWSQLPLLPDLSALTELKTLVLVLSGELEKESAVRELSRVTKLESVRNLTLGLDGSNISILPDFTEPNELDALTLNLRNSQIGDLSKLAQLQKLTQLTLHLESTPQLNRLPDLNALAKLHNLALYLYLSNIRELPNLSGSSELRTLNLALSGSKIQTLPNLNHLTSLKSITLDFCNSPITDLSEVQKLPILTEVALDKRFPSLADLPNTVEKLSLCR
jgi:conflict system STAND superfamily ATPase